MSDLFRLFQTELLPFLRTQFLYFLTEKTETFGLTFPNVFYLIPELDNILKNDTNGI